MSEKNRLTVRDLGHARKYLEWGIQNEKDGNAFYMKAAETTSSPAGRLMFTTLGKDEFEHLRILEEALAGLEQSEAFAAVDPSRMFEVSLHENPKLFPESELSRINQDTFEMQALKFGIETEHRSIRMYTQAGQELTDPDARTVFAWLVDQERQHAFILESEYQYLSGSGFHYGKMEFSIEQSDGA